MKKEGFRIDYKTYMENRYSIQAQGYKDLELYLSLKNDFYLEKVHSTDNIGFNFMLQAPNSINLITQDRDIYSQSLSCLDRLSTRAVILDSKVIVVKVNKSIKDLTLRENISILIDSISDFLSSTEGQGTILCLENDYECEIGSLTVLYNLIQYLNTSRVKLCYNVANSYSMGFNLDRDKLEKLLSITEVIKLTSIDKSIKRGSRKIPNYNLSIKDSKYYKKLEFLRKIDLPVII